MRRKPKSSLGIAGPLAAGCGGLVLGGIALMGIIALIPRATDVVPVFLNNLTGVILVFFVPCFCSAYLSGGNGLLWSIWWYLFMNIARLITVAWLGSRASGHFWLPSPRIILADFTTFISSLVAAVVAGFIGVQLRAWVESVREHGTRRKS